MINAFGKNTVQQNNIGVTSLTVGTITRFFHDGINKEGYNNQTYSQGSTQQKI